MARVLDDLAAEYAIGRLEGPDLETFARALAAASPADRERCAALQETAAALAELVAVVDPPARVRDALIQRSRTAPFSVTRADEDWRAHPVPGVSYKQLRIDAATGQATLLFKLAPDTRFPSHHHSGAEQCLILEGDLHAGGVRLGPGDFQVAAPGSDHGESYSEHGCTLMLLVAASDYVPAAGD